MKKIFILILALFAFTKIVNAECTCNYKGTIIDEAFVNDEEDIDITLTMWSKEITIDMHWSDDLTAYAEIIDPLLNSSPNATVESLAKKLNYSCPPIRVCLADFDFQCDLLGDPLGCVDSTLNVLNDTYAIIIDPSNNILDESKLPFSFYMGGGHNYEIDELEQCIDVEPGEDNSTCEILEKTPFECDYAEGQVENLEKLYCNSKDKECDTADLIKYKTEKEELKTFCNQTLKYQSVTTNSCVVYCLDIEDKIARIEGIDSTQQSCGFSSRLLLFIGNIIKWLKYIVPVIVIILGIIDFIKAIATDKDDEMKKAQKRFIIRLIAAALIFIIPFIIEFILDIFGFDKYIDGCGIFDI